MMKYYIVHLNGQTQKKSTVVVLHSFTKEELEWGEFYGDGGIHKGKPTNELMICVHITSW